MPSASQCFGLYENENIIGFIAVLHQPHGINKKIKRCSRLVILPDYQGIGLGRKFLESIAKLYISQGYDFTITTTAKNLINALRKSNDWCMMRYGVNKCLSVKSAIDYNRKSLRTQSARWNLSRSSERTTFLSPMPRLTTLSMQQKTTSNNPREGQLSLKS